MTKLKTYDIDNVIKNDTYDGFTAQLVVNSIPIDITGYEIKMFFRRRSKTGKLTKLLSVGSGITIINATEGRFKIDAFIVDIDADTYFYDVQFTSTTGRVKTYVTGTFKVIQDVTYD